MGLRPYRIALLLAFLVIPALPSHARRGQAYIDGVVELYATLTGDCLFCIDTSILDAFRRMLKGREKPRVRIHGTLW